MTSSVPVLSFGLVDARPVFMDLGDDSYFMLEPEEEAEFLELIRSEGQWLPATDHLDQALGASLIQPIERGACTRPQRSLLEESSSLANAQLADIGRAAVLLRSVKRSIARQPIDHILGALVPAGDRLPDDRADGQLARAARFIAARRFVPVKPNCLLDSIALLRWLEPEAAGASLVFGVKLEPFAAHCWVQNDTMVLNDLTDHVARFEPVRVIRCSAPTR